MRARRSPRPVGLAVALGLALAAVSPAQPVAPPTEPQIRALLREAETDAQDDPGEIVLGLDRRFRARWGDFESFPLSIARREDLSIVLTTPYMTFRRTVADHLRIHRPLGEVAWIDAVVVSVSPARIGAPDIATVRVERDGVDIPPLKDLLRPMTFTNGRGETAVLHAGDVQFPVSAFAPGATVTVTAGAGDGDPFVLTLQDLELRQLK